VRINKIKRSLIKKSARYQFYDRDGSEAPKICINVQTNTKSSARFFFIFIKITQREILNKNGL
jgi:hypothetical protein